MHRSTSAVGSPPGQAEVTCWEICERQLWAHCAAACVVAWLVALLARPQSVVYIDANPICRYSGQICARHVFMPLMASLLLHKHWTTPSESPAAMLHEEAIVVWIWSSHAVKHAICLTSSGVLRGAWAVCAAARAEKEKTVHARRTRREEECMAGK